MGKTILGQPARYRTRAKRFTSLLLLLHSNFPLIETSPFGKKKTFIFVQEVKSQLQRRKVPIKVNLTQVSNLPKFIYI